MDGTEGLAERSAVFVNGVRYIATETSVWKFQNDTLSLFTGGDIDGFRDGTRGEAIFGHIQCIRYHPSTNSLIVADSGNNLIRQVFICKDLVVTLAGRFAEITLDGVGREAGFQRPRSLAVDTDMTVIVLEWGVPKEISRTSCAGSIRRIDVVTGRVTTIVREVPFLRCIARSGDLRWPWYISVGHQILKMNNTGEIKIFVGKMNDHGHTDGDQSLFYDPIDLLVTHTDMGEQLIVMDYSNNAVRAVLPNGKTKTVASFHKIMSMTWGCGAKIMVNVPTGVYGVYKSCAMDGYYPLDEWVHYPHKDVLSLVESGKVTVSPYISVYLHPHHILYYWAQRRDATHRACFAALYAGSGTAAIQAPLRRLSAPPIQRRLKEYLDKLSFAAMTAGSGSSVHNGARLRWITGGATAKTAGCAWPIRKRVVSYLVEPEALAREAASSLIIQSWPIRKIIAAGHPV